MKSMRLSEVNSHITLRCGQKDAGTKPKVIIPKTIKLKGGKYNGGK